MVGDGMSKLLIRCLEISRKSDTCVTSNSVRGYFFPTLLAPSFVQIIEAPVN